MLFLTDIIENTTISYLPKVKSSSNALYLFLVFGALITLAILPYIKTDIAIKAAGITRPISERTDVKAIQNGIIDTLYYTEGSSVAAGATILRLKDNTTQSKTILNEFEITQRRQFIHDLEILTTSQNLSGELSLVSPLYKEQYNRFIHQLADQKASLKKADKELEMNTSLANDKVISKKEFFDTQINQEKIQSSYKAFVQEQLSNWQQDLVKYKLELSQYQQQLQQVNTDAAYYFVKAPVSGIVQGINTRYAGGLLQAGETVCNISPEGNLIAECYVPGKDVGLLKKDQPVRYQIEAFDYNYFGSLTGRIISIDNDFTSIDNKAVFKVRCSFDSTQMHLKNGFAGKLKKGLGFQARFVIARRSLWQLLFDKLDNWLNPVAPEKNEL